MTRLSALRRQLNSLRRSRQTARWLTAFAAVIVAALWILGAIFVLDVLLELTVLQRVILMAVGAVGLVWAVSKFAMPLLNVHEDEVDMALMVQRQHGIDSDLVAAMQFESPEADRWGSRELENAVIDYVADLDKGLNVYEGFSREQMVRRVAILGVTVAVAVVAVLLVPQYFQVFLQRMAFSNRHYPTNTVIERIAINQSDVLLKERHGTSPEPAKAAQGQSLVVAAWTTGVKPSQGEMTLGSRFVGGARQLQLTRVDRKELEKARDQLTQASLLSSSTPEESSLADEETRRELAMLASSISQSDLLSLEEALANPIQNKAAVTAAKTRVENLLTDWPDASDATLFVAKLPRLLDDVEYTVRLGDAWTDDAEIAMIPLPVIEPKLDVLPPAYARTSRDEADENITSMQRSVIEGSRVDLSLTASKPLASATLHLLDSDGIAPDQIALTAQDKEGKQWKLERATPLSTVNRPLRFQLQVKDKDGLQLASPLRGYIRLKADRPPRITGSVVHSSWVSEAKPEIEFHVSDDYGLAKLAVRAEVHQLADSLEGEESTHSSQTFQIDQWLPVRHNMSPQQANSRTPSQLTMPVRASNLPLNGAYKLDLSSMKLKKGDEVRLTLVATDFRGDSPGQQAESEPIVVEITDVSEILAAVSEQEKRSLEQFDDLIRRELGIGTTP